MSKEGTVDIAGHEKENDNSMDLYSGGTRAKLS